MNWTCVREADRLHRVRTERCAGDGAGPGQAWPGRMGALSRCVRALSRWLSSWPELMAAVTSSRFISVAGVRMPGFLVPGSERVGRVSKAPPLAAVWSRDGQKAFRVPLV